MKKGFSIVELSIVLVIIGLLIGAVLAGKELIRQSKIQSVIKEANLYKTAIATFYLKYDALPGDMPNAVSYWGKRAGTWVDGVDNDCATLPHGTEPYRTETCNGNGDGRIGEADTTNYHEWFRIWQHLKNAELITGEYTGVPGAASIIRFCSRGKHTDLKI